MEAIQEPGSAILDEIADLEVARARLECRIARRMLDFADLRRRQSDLAINPVIGRLEASFAADELSLVLLQAPMTVQCRLAEARRVRGLLPRTWLAWRHGEIYLVRVRHISTCVDRLQSPQSAAELDAKVVAYASTHSAAQVKAWLRRFVARVEPDQLSVRQKAEFKRRGVYVDHDADGVSWIHALISTTDASRIDVLLTSMAKGWRDWMRLRANPSTVVSPCRRR